MVFRNEWATASPKGDPFGEPGVLGLMRCGIESKIEQETQSRIKKEGTFRRIQWSLLPTDETKDLIRTDPYQ